jgi:hypothetical protein
MHWFLLLLLIILNVHPTCLTPSQLVLGGQLPIIRDTSSEITGLANIAKLIPLRKTSALLKGHAPHEFDDIIPGAALFATPRSSFARGRADSAHISCESVESPSLKREPEVKLEATAAAEKHPRNFCPSCGHNFQSVCSHASPIKHEQQNILSKLRINGTPMNAVVAEAPLLDPMHLQL